MMLAVLPRRQADDLSGELFVAAYERQLGHYPAEAVAFLCDEAIRTLKWFPTVSECLEIISRWTRRDEAVERQGLAAALVRKERIARDEEYRAQQRREQPPQITQEAVNAMSPHLIKLGLGCGALIQDDDGNVRPAPPEDA